MPFRCSGEGPVRGSGARSAPRSCRRTYSRRHNLPFSTLYRDDGTLKARRDDSKSFEGAGVHPEQAFVARCGSGVTANSLIFAARRLGGRDGLLTMAVGRNGARTRRLPRAGPGLEADTIPGRSRRGAPRRVERSSAAGWGSFPASRGAAIASSPAAGGDGARAKREQSMALHRRQRARKRASRAVASRLFCTLPKRPVRAGQRMAKTGQPRHGLG